MLLVNHFDIGSSEVFFGLHLQIGEIYGNLYWNLRILLSLFIFIISCIYLNLFFCLYINHLHIFIFAIMMSADIDTSSYFCLIEQLRKHPLAEIYVDHFFPCIDVDFKFFLKDVI